MTKTNNKFKGVILASSSKYRQALLARLKFSFAAISPEINEQPLVNESAKDLVKRLSIKKANAISNKYPSHLIIGSDQVAVFNQKIIGKPETHENAVKQLQTFSGQEIKFLTGLCVVCKESNTEHYKHSKVTVKFLELTEQQIENYLLNDKPYDCAGSFKVESLGISLFEKVESDDPTSLEGLPLITLCQLLNKCDNNILQNS